MSVVARFARPLQWLAAPVALIAAGAALSNVPAAAAPPSCEIRDVSRVVAIGDVHGAFEQFVGILKAASLIDDNRRWAGGTAHLVQLGDVVDRGPDSRSAIDLLRRLETEAARAGGGVHALLGNHEVARMLGDLRFATPGEYAAFATPKSAEVREQFIKSAKPEHRDQMLADTPLGQLEMRAAFGRNGSYGEWLRKHDTVVSINGVVFLHGGISPAVAGMSCDEINKTVRKELTGDMDKTRADPLASLAARADGPLWYRGLAQIDDGDTATIDDLLAKQHARAVVIAHTVTTDGRIRMRFDGRLFQIDTGMQPAYVTGGRASAVEFSGDQVSAIYQDRRDLLLDKF